MKGILFGLTLVLLLVMNVNLISAQNEIIDDTYDTLGEAFSSILGPLFDVEEFDDFLFVKAMIFILLFAVIFMSLKQIKIFKRSTPIRSIVAIIIAILAVRYLKEEGIITAILLPYGALGGSIIIFLPLIIYFFFVHTSIEGGFGRRAAWFIYAVILILLWGTQDAMGSANWIYYAGLGFVLVNLFMDKSIHRYFAMGKIEKAKSNVNKSAIVKLTDELAKAKMYGLDSIAKDLEDRLDNILK